MTWPEDPRSLDDIPMTEYQRQFLGMVDGQTAAVVCDVVNTHKADLERVTDGDIVKEQLLGSLLVKMSITAANVRERAMRGMSTYYV